MSKLKCISNYFCEDELTVGNIYFGRVEGDYLYLINDNGYEWRYYWPSHFVTIGEIDA